MYVSNLAWRTSWQDLKDKFREAGNVVYSNVVRDQNGRSKGWGIVEFETPEEVGSQRHGMPSVTPASGGCAACTSAAAPYGGSCLLHALIALG